MPSLKNHKTKRSIQFQPSRLIKTNGRFSKGKLAMIIVSFAAIGAIVVSVSRAWTFQYVENWPDVNSHHWYAYGYCGNGNNYCWFPANIGTPYDAIVWWGPYITMFSPNPTGTNAQFCANVNAYLSSEVYFRLELTDAYGRNSIASTGWFFQSGGAGWQLRCGTIHIPQGVYGSLEYRLRIGHNNSGELEVGQVGLFW